VDRLETIAPAIETANGRSMEPMVDRMDHVVGRMDGMLAAFMAESRRLRPVPPTVSITDPFRLGTVEAEDSPTIDTGHLVPGSYWDVRDLASPPPQGPVPKKFRVEYDLEHFQRFPHASSLYKPSFFLRLLSIKDDQQDN